MFVEAFRFGLRWCHGRIDIDFVYTIKQFTKIKDVAGITLTKYEFAETDDVYWRIS